MEKGMMLVLPLPRQQGKTAEGGFGHRQFPRFSVAVAQSRGLGRCLKRSSFRSVFVGKGLFTTIRQSREKPDRLGHPPIA